jgi:hypothetical protein
MKKDIAFFQKARDEDQVSVGFAAGPGSGVPYALWRIHLRTLTGVKGASSACAKTLSLLYASPGFTNVMKQTKPAWYVFSVMMLVVCLL